MPVRNTILRRPRASLMIAAALQTSAVVLGYFVGTAIGYPGQAPSIYTVFALFAMLLMLVGIFAALARQVEEAKYCTAVCMAVLLHSAGVIFGEPFFRVTMGDEIVVAALVLVPLLLSIEYLVRGRAWVSVTGVTLFVFTSSAMIGSNANNSVNGSGFFWSWVA